MIGDTVAQCKNCLVVNDWDDLKEIQEEKEHHSYFVCPECEGREFIKMPEKYQ